MTDGDAELSRGINSEIQKQAVTEVFQYIQSEPTRAFRQIGETMQRENGELHTYLDEQNAVFGVPGNAFREGAFWTYGVLRAQGKKSHPDPALPTVSEDVFNSIAGDMEEMRVLQNWDTDDPLSFKNALAKISSTTFQEGDEELWRKLHAISGCRTDRATLMDGASLTWLAVRKQQQADLLKTRFPEMGS